MKIVLAAVETDLADAWEHHCGDLEGVSVHRGSILDVACDAVVSPANSFGFMDGGIDLLYAHHFGWAVQDRLQELIRSRHHGELLVGSAELVETGHARIPYLIAAPTMRVPMILRDTVNPYLAAHRRLPTHPTRRRSVGNSCRIACGLDHCDRRLPRPGHGRGSGQPGHLRAPGANGHRGSRPRRPPVPTHLGRGSAKTPVALHRSRPGPPAGLMSHHSVLDRLIAEVKTAVVSTRRGENDAGAIDVFRHTPSVRSGNLPPLRPAGRWRTDCVRSRHRDFTRALEHREVA